MWQEAESWAKSEFGGTPGLNRRLERRLIHTASALTTRPQGTLPHRFNWAELKGAYNLIHATTHADALQEVHRQKTRERAVALSTPVLFIHDTTALNFSTHTAIADQLGPIGDRVSNARGFIQHNSLVVDPSAGHLLGLIHQQTFLRTLKPEGETRAARYQRPVRESAVWTRGMEAVGRAPDNCQWIHVGDRGADFFGAMATPRQLNAHFLIRLVQDRSIQPTTESADDDEMATSLMQAARQVTATTSSEVRVASRGGRPGRVATVKLGSVRLTVRPSKADPLWRHTPPITLTVVRIWEENPPPGVEALEWILGTDLPDDSAEALLQYQSWYQWRWPTMEEYHKAQKTGCRIEDLRFETVDRLRAAIALLSVIAVRILQLRWCRDASPDAPAETVASADELTVLQGLQPNKPITTVKQFVNRVAGLGGYLGRKCDGPPGWQSLWRGYQRLADILLGFTLAEKPKPTTVTS